MATAVAISPRPGTATAVNRPTAPTSASVNSPAPMSANGQRRTINPPSNPTVPARISAAAPASAAGTVCAWASAVVASPTETSTASPCSIHAASSR
jgi:hypothetical protein